MKQPEDFEEKGLNGEKLVCKFNKRLYGLEQSGRDWYYTLKAFLEKIGFVGCVHDSCLFVRHVNDCVNAVVGVCVDDIIYCGKGDDFVNWFAKEVKTKFRVSECCMLRWFLGLNVTVNETSITVNQEKYIENLLKKFGMSDCKALRTPMVEHVKLTKDMSLLEGSEEQRVMSERNSRGLIGSLNFLSLSSRPDIAQASHVLSSFLENPGEQHWVAAKHILRYLQWTKYLCLTFKKCDSGMGLVGYSDSDWAGNEDQRKSTSGYCFKLNESSACVSWLSKVQSAVATSTAEAEMNACKSAAQECVYLTGGLLRELSVRVVELLCLYDDNQASIELSKNSLHHGKTKHFATKLPFIRDLCEKQRVKLIYTLTDKQPADILTKILGRNKTQTFRKFFLGNM